MTIAHRVIYTIDVPFSENTIEVFGDPHMGWYDWRIITPNFEVLHKTNQGYGAPGIALRDALIFVTK